MKSPRSRLAILAAQALLVLALLLPARSVLADARDPGAQPGTAPTTAHFIIRLRPARLQGEVTEEEKTKIRRHFEYLKGLLEEGKLLVAGLAEDDFQEIVLIQARDRMEAEKIMASDPAVGANLFLAELHPFRVALMAKNR
jgi:uncharacterized protein YciI